MKALKEILGRAVDIDFADAQGNTALHNAAHSGKVLFTHVVAVDHGSYGISTNICCHE